MIFKIDYYLFAKAVAEKRAAEQKTLRELSAELGMSAATLCRAESGFPIKAHHFITLLYWMNTNVELFRERE